MVEHYTKSQAKGKLLLSSVCQEELTCPIFKRLCFNNCASFNKGGVTRIGVYQHDYINMKKENPEAEDEDLEIWSFYKCSCLNAIVSGYIQMDMDQ